MEQEENAMRTTGKKKSRADTRKLFIRIVALGCALLIAGSALLMAFL